MKRSWQKLLYWFVSGLLYLALAEIASMTHDGSGIFDGAAFPRTPPMPWPL